MLYIGTYVNLWSYLAQFFLEWEMLQVKVVEKTKTLILCPVTFFRKLCRLWDNVEKYGRAGEATDGNMAYAHCMRYTYGYKHTLGLCCTYYFSTANMVARMRLSVTSYIHCFVSLKFLYFIVSVLHLIFFTASFVFLWPCIISIGK